jgi:hypothetical protein
MENQITELSSFEIDETNGGLPESVKAVARAIGAALHEIFCGDH